MKPRIVNLAWRWIWIAIHQEAVAPVFPGELQRHRHSSRFNSGHAFKFLDERIEECIQFRLSLVLVQG